MRVATLESIISRSDLPTLPTVYSRLEAAIEDPRSSTTSISAVISSDATLTARLLRIANSAMFQFPSQITSISTAVRVVGTRQIRDLALATIVIGMFERFNPPVGKMEMFWQHSIACGVAARVVGAQRREVNVERFFVAGLLHDIGSLLLYLHMPEQMMVAMKHASEGSLPLHVIEKDLIGFDHAELGAALLSQWGLPAALHRAVRYHHSPDQCVDFRMDASIVHVSDVIVNALEIGNRPDAFVPPLMDEVWASLGLPTAVLAPSIEQIDRQITVMSNVMQGKT